MYWGNPADYDPVRAGARAMSMKKVVRQHKKLASRTALFGVVEYFLRYRWSPEQIGGTLRRMIPVDLSKRASQETINTALYSMQRGKLRRELIAYPTKIKTCDVRDHRTTIDAVN